MIRILSPREALFLSVSVTSRPLNYSTNGLSADGSVRSLPKTVRNQSVLKEFINDELVLASKNHDMSMLKKLEPFDTENNKAYKPEYIAGFVAERYSLGLKDAWKTAMVSIKEKLNRHISDNIRSKQHADRVRNLHVGTDYSNITYKYLLLPIWVSNFKYNDKVYQFMVNGQTGKVSGKTPLSIPKIIITVVAVIAIIAILYYFGVLS